MAKTVVFVVLSPRRERTKGTLKGIPLRIPLKFAKVHNNRIAFLQKHAVVNVLLKLYQQNDVCEKFEVLRYNLYCRVRVYTPS